MAKRKSSTKRVIRKDSGHSTALAATSLAHRLKSAMQVFLYGTRETQICVPTKL